MGSILIVLRLRTLRRLERGRRPGGRRRGGREREGGRVGDLATGPRRASPTRAIGVAVALAAVAGVTGGCAPLAQPWVFAETASVLKEGQVRLTPGGGVAVNPKRWEQDNMLFWGGGAGARVRVGVGHRQEIGAEATVSWRNANSVLSSRPYMVAAKLSWKYAPIDGLALVVVAGGAGNTAEGESGGAVGADAAFIVSHAFGAFEPFAGLRGGAVLSGSQSLSVLFGVVGAAGVSIGLGGPASLIVEAGVPWMRAWEGGDLWGCYGLVALSFVMGGGATTP